MWNKLESWRKKDEGARRFAAICVASSVTLVIAVVWTTVFFSGSAEQLAAAPAAIASSEVAEGPIASFGESTVHAWQSLVEQFSQVVGTFENLEDLENNLENTENPNPRPFIGTTTTATYVKTGTTTATTSAQ